MKCPKCGSRHIVDGMCVMCGTMVIHDVQTPERICLACGRKERFVGSVCKDCGDAISRGAKTLQKAAQRNINSDKAPVFAECPVLPFLDELWQKIHAWREHQREVARAWKARNPEKLAAQRERAKQRVAENREEFNRRRRENEAYQLWVKQYRSTPEYKAKQREYDKHRRQKPEQMEMRRAADRERARRKAAEFRALPPEEQKRIRVEYKASPAYQKKLERDRRYAAKRRSDPVRVEQMRECTRRYEHSEKGQTVRAKARERAKQTRRLIRDNEALEREAVFSRLNQEREAAARYEQWEAFGTEDRGNQGAVRGDRLGGDHVGESELGVVVNGRVCTPEGPQVAEDGTVGV